MLVHYLAEIMEREKHVPFLLTTLLSIGEVL